ERAPKPVLTVEECFAHSSNVGMSKIAYNTFATQPTKFLDYLHKYRLDTITGIDLPGEENPRLPKMSKSNEGLHAMVTMSFGYAIQVSPLQTLTLYNAVANNGKMMRPYLVNAITNDGLPVKQFSPFTISESIATPAVIKAAQESMHDVTVEGTAKGVFKNTAYAVAGKTGTAHVADGKYGYNDGVYQASFVGYFPYENPMYTCIVVIKTKPYAPLHYGGQLAAPVFKEISDRLYTLEIRQGSNYTFSNINDSNNYRYAGQAEDFKILMQHMGIPYKDSTRTFGSWSVLQKSLNGPVLFASNETNKTMPDLKGLGLKDAVYLCENAGLKVNIKGRGKVIAQSLGSGNNIVKGQVVEILLN
ncbi:MAG: penicillin-binding transpeptidase domain-containing protein, partial [Bacteroidota bacterium]